MLDFKVYIGGIFQPTPHIHEVHNSYNGHAIGSTYLCSAKELEQAVVAAEACQKQLAQMPSHKKYKILTQIAFELEQAQNEIAEVLSQEACKPINYALGEVGRAAEVFRIAAEEAKRLPGEVLSIDWTPAGEGKEGIVKYFPVGVIAGIAPFNFPLNLTAHKLAPAIAAGCPIVLKPASSTPLSALMLAQIIDRTDLPKGAVSIIPMNRETGNLLVSDERFKLLSFTGSPQVGWSMKQKAGKKKVLLELGGNAGVIVSPTANIQHAIQKCIAGGFAYSGQVCIHTQRIFVHRDVFDDFMEGFLKGVKALREGDPIDPHTDISAMIDQPNAERVEQWVDEAVSQGAKVLLGGQREGAYFPPTVLTNTANEMKVCALEVFGPVVVVEPYAAFNEAVNAVNQSQFGLQAGVFTNQLDEMNLAFSQLEVGGLILNDVPTFRVDHMPYGGVKESGLGREGVRYAMLEMLEPRILVKPME